MDYFYNDLVPTFKADGLQGYREVYDERAIRNSLLNIFVIKKGTVPGKPAFGNPLDLAAFDLFDFYNVRIMEDLIANIIYKYEPRVKLQLIDITAAPEYNRIIINIEYSYVIDDVMVYDRLAIPYSHNSISFLGGRVRDPIPEAGLPVCDI